MRIWQIWSKFRSAFGRRLSRSVLDARLLAVLVCPTTHEPLRYDPQLDLLIADGARLAYPVRDGIPILLAEEAKPWTR